jgi:nucleotide-binding universal stress UspA family protein
MNGPIVVPLDGSALAENAVPLAASLARKRSNTVLLLQVLPPVQAIYWGYGGVISSEEQVRLLRTEMESYLSAVAERLAEQGVPAAQVVGDGPVGETIVRVAEERDATTIVMSTHGRGGLARWALGSVAGRVLHLTDRPLVLLPPRHERHLSLCGPMPALKRIVVPLDGSPQAEQILPHVKALAARYGSELMLVRALSSIPPLMPGAEIGMVNFGLQDAMREEAQAYLRHVQSRLEKEGFRVRTSLGVEPAANAILEVADEINADLIAMTSHAREGLSRLILGSVTDRVVRAGTHPVFVTRLVQRAPRTGEVESPAMSDAGSAEPELAGVER